MLSFENFCDQVKDHLENYFSHSESEISILLSDVVKNNDSHLVGISYSKDGECSSPIVYLNDYFEDHKKGRPVFNIISDVAKQFDRHAQDPIVNRVQGLMNDLDYVKSHIVFQIVNHDMNQDFLADRPHRDIEDLSAIYVLDLGPDSINDEMCTATVKITNDVMNRFGFSENELFELAKKNSNELFPAKYDDMSAVLSVMMGNNYSNDLFPSEMNPLDRIFVVTNERNLQGASVVLYSDVLDKISDELGTDLYVLPSSIHEVLALSADGKNVNELVSMVTEINHTVVDPKEVLSDNVYFYNREERKLTLADKNENVSEKIMDNSAQKRQSFTHR